ncbi:unnamed protein product [Meganyctiphanes norvegica]|uniref:Ras GTPase-activating protein-binding protein 2 n=1 Tax=Meganyctiphanes norvegica TaxID=48144 RepID=A0AAV2RVM0_MEGNR
MVMETPSPQCVGLEFVRQYYTVLNKAPEHLHRFYSNNSSFMHGRHNDHNGQPIIGQHDIHKKILSLNFRDCHAKIRLVDAHATLANGVVIQVTGELSNGGMPLRRFMQSFVLAPQTPKKYYVHNDIFRYQDEVFSDEDGGDEGVSEGEEELDTPGMVEPNVVYHSPSPTAPPTVNGTAHHQEPEPQITAPLHTPTPQVVPPTGGVSPTAATTPVMPAAPPSPTPPTPTPADPAPPTPPTPEKEEISWVPNASSESWDVATEAANSSWVEPTSTTKDTPDPDPPLSEAPTVHQPVAPQEPKTFANLFKNTSGYSPVISSAPTPAAPVAASQPPVPAASPQQPQPPPAAAPAPVAAPPVAAVPAPQQQQQQQQPPPPPQQSANTDYNEDLSWGSNDGWTETSQRSGQGFAQRQNRNPGQSRQPPRDRPYRPASEENADFESFGEDRRRAPNVPDSQQIFVGNLPHATTEEELKTEFSRFGKIVDVRINTAKGKTGPKGQGHQVPNFGFVTFEEENSVNKVLSSRPIHLNGDHRLNVEEKKARQRMDGGGMGRQGSGRGMGERGGMRQGMSDRGGMQGGRGGRGGFNRDNTRGGPGGSRGNYQRR